MCNSIHDKRLNVLALLLDSICFIAIDYIISCCCIAFSFSFVYMLLIALRIGIYLMFGSRLKRICFGKWLRLVIIACCIVASASLTFWVGMPDMREVVKIVQHQIG